MPDTLEEEARRCPKCQEPGRVSSKKNLRGEGTLYTYVCENERCKYVGDHWIVQVKPDGTIPLRKPDDKEFPKDVYSEKAGQRMVENVQEELERGEIRYR